MHALDGIWRLVEASAWDAGDAPLAPPYGVRPMGQIMFAQGRMLSVLCNGDADAPAGRGYTSYGGPYTFDGTTLETVVDMASDPTRIGSRQVRTVVMRGRQMLLQPPARAYSGTGNGPGAGPSQRRELVWEQVWQPPTGS